MLNNKTSVRFNNQNTEIPIIKFSLSSGVEFNAIIDTGSESTVFDGTFVNENKPEFSLESPHMMALIGFSGNQTNTVSNVSATVILKDKIFLVSGITSDLKELNNNIHTFCCKDIDVSAIIGCDMLTQLEAVIDFKKQTIKLNL